MSDMEKTLLEAAQAVVEKLRKEPSTLSVIMTGPAALGKTPPNAKLYIAVITNQTEGVIEHHFLDDGWEEIKIPIEMGKFPLSVVRHLLENGYSDMVSYKTLEAFRCGRVLWERDNVGTEAVQGAEKHIPTRTFVGEHLHGTVSDLDDAVALLKGGDYVNAVIVAREAAAKAVAMAIADHPPEGNVSFLQAAKTTLPPEMYERYLEVAGLKEVDAPSAERNARRVLDFVTYTLQRIGVNPEYVLGRSDKEQQP
jgi:hypothetical protein